MGAYLWAAVWIAAGHMVQPQHWLPYAALARRHGWPLGRLLAVTLAVTGLHVAGTLLLAALATLLRHVLAPTVLHTAGHAAGWVLVGLGALHLIPSIRLERALRPLAWVVLVTTGAQPHLEVLPLLAAAALARGYGALAVAGAWALAALAAALALVSLAFAGLGTNRWLTADRGRVLTAAVLLLSGTVTLWHRH